MEIPSGIAVALAVLIIAILSGMGFIFFNRYRRYRRSNKIRRVTAWMTALSPTGTLTDAQRRAIAVLVDGAATRAHLKNRETFLAAHAGELTEDEALAAKAALIEESLDPSAPRRGVAVTLGGMKATEMPVSFIAAALRDEDRSVRLAAAASLENIATNEAAKALIEGLRENLLNPERLTERLSHEWAALALLEAIVPVPEPEENDIRKWLATALAQIASPAAVPALIDLTFSEDKENRLSATKGLGKCGKGSKHAWERVRELAVDPDVDVRAQAVTALGRIGGTADIPLLVEATKDEGWYVRGNAARALLALGDEGELALHDIAENSTDRYAAERAAEVLRSRLGELNDN